MKKDFAEKLKELRSKHLLKDPEVRLAIEVLKRKGVTLQDIEKAYHYLNDQYFQNGRPLSRKQIDQVLDAVWKEFVENWSKFQKDWEGYIGQGRVKEEGDEFK